MYIALRCNSYRLHVSNFATCQKSSPAKSERLVRVKSPQCIAAGFKVIVPTTAAQTQKLQTLPAGKVTLVPKEGKTYHVFSDAVNNQAYVGGPTQYQAYKQLRLANKLANGNLEAAEMNQDASMNWGAWRGWLGRDG